MIKSLSKRIVSYLINLEVIDNSEESVAYYSYGAEITISSFINVLLVLFVGAITSNFFESITFLLCFIPLRQFTGGYHANTYFKCIFLFTLLFSIMLLIYRIILPYFSIYAAIIMLLFNIVTLISKCPVENKNKPLTDKQKKKYKCLAVTLGLFYSFIGVISKVFSYNIGVIFIFTSVLVSILVIVATIQ